MSATRPDRLYETDFYAWTQGQAKELRRFARTRPNLPLDLAHPGCFRLDGGAPGGGPCPRRGVEQGRPSAPSSAAS